jgi:hypothetical protein
MLAFFWRRAAGAALVATAGALHLYLWSDYFHRVHVIGALFLANAASGFAIAAALLASRNVLMLLAGVGFAAGTLVAFAISTHFGLFGYRESFWGGWQEAAGGVELAAVLVLGDALRAERYVVAAPATST